MTKQAILLLLISFQSYAGLFSSTNEQIEQCMELFKTTHQIKFYVKHTDVVKQQTNKYEFTPVSVVRGKETPFTRQYCEYYPEENMVYIGIANSVVQERQKVEEARLKRKLIEDRKAREKLEQEKQHKARLQAIEDEAKKQELLDRKRREAELAIAKQKEARKAEKQRKDFVAKYLPSAEECVKQDQRRIDAYLTERTTPKRNIVAKEQKIKNIAANEDYLRVDYEFYSYDLKKHKRWKATNGDTAGRLFRNQTKTYCRLSELTKAP